LIGVELSLTSAILHLNSEKSDLVTYEGVTLYYIETIMSMINRKCCDFKIGLFI